MSNNSHNDQRRPKSREHTQEDERLREARRTLDAVERESETIGRSAFVRAANAAKSFERQEGRDENDNIELWGKRIGRGLGYLFAAGLLVYLLKTYVFS